MNVDAEKARILLASATDLLDSNLAKLEDGTVNPHYTMRRQRLRETWLIAELLHHFLGKQKVDGANDVPLVATILRRHGVNQQEFLVIFTQLV